MMHPNPSEDVLYDEVHGLVTAVLQDLSPEASERLAAFLTVGGDRAQRCYTYYMHETYALRGAGSTVSQVLPNVQSGSHGVDLRTMEQRTRRSLLMGFSTIVAVAASLVVAFSRWQPTEPRSLDRTQALDASNKPVATLVRATRVQWHPDDAGLSELSRLVPGKRIRIESGKIEILFDSGVELVIAGRTDAVIDSSMRVVAKLGKFSARAGERGRGFTIETPATSVIDLGTEFGVDIDPSGSTKVAVFKGEVDLKYINASNPGIDRSVERLRVGEAVQIDTGGVPRRLVAIDSDSFPMPGSDGDLRSMHPELFSAINDNIRTPENKKYYRIVRTGLFDDVCAYVDRDHEWNGLDGHGLPSILRGADYIMTFNNDKFVANFQLTLSIAAPCTLYVFFDNNMVAPDWLLAAFEDTGIDIGLDQAYGRYSGDSSVASGGGMSIDDTFSVWSREVKRPGDLHLGNVDKPADKEAGWNMYGIAAKPIFVNGAGR